MNTTNGFVISNGVLKEYRGLESNVVIPDGVEVIGPSAFTERSGIRSISFPHTLNTIGSHAFYNCSDLESVSLPDGLVEIGNYAFGKCKKLKNIAIPDSVVIFGEGFLLFCYCDITTNIWPSQLSHAIEDYEIRGIHTEYISSIPSAYKRKAAVGFASEKDIDFTSERALSHLKYIKRNVEKLCETAIENPPLLQLMCEKRLIGEKDIDLYLNTAKEAKDDEIIALLGKYQSALDQGRIKEVREQKKTDEEKKKEQALLHQASRKQTDGIRGITFVLSGKLTNQSYYYYAKLWKNRRELEEYLHFYGAELSDKVTAKTDYVVSCFTEPSIKKEETAKALGIPIITEDEFHTLIGKKYIRSKQIIVPSWIKMIPRYAFYGVETYNVISGHEDDNILETLILPDGLEKIEAEAFSYCRKLEQVTIPSTVKSIGERAFESCVSLIEIVIPDSISCLERNVFCDCSALTKVIIPDSVTQISKSAFQNCPNITIYTPSGSYAEQFAIIAGIPVFTINNAI